MKIIDTLMQFARIGHLLKQKKKGFLKSKNSYTNRNILKILLNYISQISSPRIYSFAQSKTESNYSVTGSVLKLVTHW